MPRREKITITIEDLPDGSVSIVCLPGFKDLMNTFVNRRSDLTSAQVYALGMLNRAREINKADRRSQPHANRLVTLDDA